MKSRSMTVLVTGGSRGLGAHISRAFHAAGYSVFIASRTDTGLANELGARARFQKTDVRNVGDLHAAAAAARDWNGTLDVLVNNAGISAWRPLAEIDEKFFAEMLDTNLKSVLFGSQAAAAVMKNGAAIVNISSLAGKRGSANNSAYCAAKFGVNGVTQSLAKELGPRGIRVNAVCPVYIRTEGLEDALTDPRSPTAGNDTGEYLKQFAASQTALGVLPTGAQVAAACVYLASPAAGAITGQCINVDCGVLPQ